MQIYAKNTLKKTLQVKYDHMRILCFFREIMLDFHQKFPYVMRICVYNDVCSIILGKLKCLNHRIKFNRCTFNCTFNIFLGLFAYHDLVKTLSQNIKPRPIYRYTFLCGFDKYGLCYPNASLYVNTDRFSTIHKVQRAKLVGHTGV